MGHWVKAKVLGVKQAVAAVVALGTMGVVAGPAFAAGTVDPSVQAASDATTGFVTNNAVVIMGVFAAVAALGFAGRFVYKRIRHAA
jgi:hypothetical protein